ncbi:hypothetical protein GOODEAATRI_029339 [Goodea atripinnis]|uniref:Integrase p58-like C-terminal domain-containing protein n=1 Tax=Goodea atripinnis TaxID=208336 RepID=A0ABV0PI61_9TELE
MLFGREITEPIDLVAVPLPDNGCSNIPQIRKFLPSYDGPYFVTGTLDDLVYCIKKGPRSRAKVVHHDKLKPYYTRTPLDNSWVFQNTRSPASVEVPPPVVDTSSDVDHDGPLNPWDGFSEIKESTVDHPSQCLPAHAVSCGDSQIQNEDCQFLPEGVDTEDSVEEQRPLVLQRAGPHQRTQRRRRPPDRFGQWVSG